jgi:uroporphyrinogen-III synthase
MAAMKFWNRNNMRDRNYTILSTSSIPVERIHKMPDSVSLQIIPFIEVTPHSDERLKKQIERLAEKKTTVIFTSAYAVKSVLALLSHKPDWIFYCIRHETRLAIEKGFGTNHVLKTADNAKSLSELILHDKIQETVFFCGDQRMDILPDNLRKKNIELEEVIVYDTRLTPVRLSFEPDAILFFSPSAVRSFFSVNKISHSTALFAMGRTTAAALKQNTNQPIIISPEADKSFVLNLALEYAGSHPIT